MAWYNEMSLLLRHLINDLDPDNESYDDDRLEECLIASAQFLIPQIDFDNAYTINIDEHSITPDPTKAGSKDDDFIGLTVLKAATIILAGEAKALAGQSYMIKDGPSTIDVRGAYSATKDLLKQMQDDLASAIQQYKCGNAVVGKAIVSSYTVQQVNSRYHIF